jgi:hypothetical protein
VCACALYVTDSSLKTHYRPPSTQYRMIRENEYLRRNFFDVLDEECVSCEKRLMLDDLNVSEHLVVVRQALVQVTAELFVYKDGKNHDEQMAMFQQMYDQEDGLAAVRMDKPEVMGHVKTLLGAGLSCWHVGHALKLGRCPTQSSVPNADGALKSAFAPSSGYSINAFVGPVGSGATSLRSGGSEDAEHRDKKRSQESQDEVRTRHVVCICVCA